MSSRPLDKSERNFKRPPKVFLETTMPLIDYYKAKDLLKQYDGNVPPEPSIARAREIIEGLVK